MNLGAVARSKSIATYILIWSDTGLEILNEVRANVSLQFRNSERALANIRESALKSYYDYQGDRHDFDFLERFKNVLVESKQVIT